ncbi:MAG: rod shape-determining protein MreC [Verrucomicrobiota bacterium]|jgi:rod shape-determining protein MreC|nr:rod shape-determining protein MreC [Verrucomicrobiota bacterium]|tara:strand:+ start:97 stop:933 length:837 start_codon:yes stop_codon:yes gene_type:complete
MKRFFYKSQQTAVGAVLLTVFLLLVMPEGVRARLKSAIGGLFLPALSISTTGQAALESLGQLGVSDRDPFPTNQALGQGSGATSSITELQLENDRLAGENKRLRDAAEWEQRIPWETRLVRVVGRDPFNWWRRIKVNLGTNKEARLRLNQPIISVRGELVGRISEVGPLTSWVLLVGDPNCRFSALLKESRSQGGIVSPRQYSADPRVVELTYLPNDVEVRPGQAVVTSGMGGAFPKEIPVGQVVDSWVSKNGLYTEARVKLHANLNQLETVRVLVKY